MTRNYPGGYFKLLVFSDVSYVVQAISVVSGIELCPSCAQKHTAREITNEFNTRFIQPCTCSPQAQAEGANWEALNGHKRGGKGSRGSTPCHSLLHSMTGRAPAVRTPVKLVVFFFPLGHLWAGKESSVTLPSCSRRGPCSSPWVICSSCGLQSEQERARGLRKPPWHQLGWAHRGRTRASPPQSFKTRC